MFTAALFTVTRTQKQPKCPSIEAWIKKMWYYVVYVHSGILLSQKKKKKEQNNVICSNMDVTRNYHISEVSQREKDKYRMISLIHRV